MSDEQQQQQLLQQEQNHQKSTDSSENENDFWVAESVKDRTFDEDFDLGYEFSYQT